MMSESMFLPLYTQAQQAMEQNRSDWFSLKNTSANQGLLFDKFGDAWANDSKSGEPKFDKEQKVGSHKAGAWLKKFERKVGHDGQLQEACDRQASLAKACGGAVFHVKNTQRFVTGMGRNHPLENGFTWHPILGTPYLPGSSLKGLLRAWLRETTGGIETNNKGQQEFRESDAIREWFGGQDQVGRLVLLDMLPVKSVQLQVDVMTPHHGSYYKADPKSAEVPAPGDWEDPVPISFLTVAANASWQLAFVPASIQAKLSSEVQDEFRRHLCTALSESGAGAKTAVGYGRFVVDLAVQQELEAKAEIARKQAEEAAKQREQEQKERQQREAALKGASDAKAFLVERSSSESWNPAANDDRMLAGLDEFAAQYPEPPADAVEWVQHFLNQGFKGVWNNPKATKGKKKELRHNRKIVERVLKINPEFRGQTLD